MQCMSKSCWFREKKIGSLWQMMRCMLRVHSRSSHSFSCKSVVALQHCACCTVPKRKKNLQKKKKLSVSRRKVQLKKSAEREKKSETAVTRLELSATRCFYLHVSNITLFSITPILH